MAVAVGFAVPVAGAVAVGLIDLGIIIRACQDILWSPICVFVLLKYLHTQTVGASYLKC